MNLLEFAEEEHEKALGRAHALKEFIRFVRKTQKRSENVLVCEGPIGPKIWKHLRKQQNTWAEGVKIGGTNATYKHARLLAINEIIEEIKRMEGS